MLTLAEVKQHLRVEIDDDDTLINTLISAAYQFAENYTNRAILQRTETLTIDDFSGVIELPYLPVISLTSIGYTDKDNSPQAFSDYYLDLRGLFAKLMPKKSFSWPQTNCDYENVSIVYEVGYTLIDEQINQAVLLLIGSMYEQRENDIVGVAINKIPLSAEYLLNPYRVVSV